MHKRIVFHIISRILWIVCFAMVVPLGWAVRADADSPEVKAFIFAILFGLLLAVVCRLFIKVRPDDLKRLNAKDGLAIVGLTWLILSVFGALPLVWSGTASFTDAFFEITSGFTTTGASVFADVEALPPGILFWRSMTHWLGGMGIVVLYLALLPTMGLNTLQLYRAETSAVVRERIEPRIKETAKALWLAYALFTVVEVVLHLLGGMSVFDALCQTFGAVATGGFSTRNASLGAFSAYHQWVVIAFMFIGGTNFLLHHLALRGDLRAYWRSEEFRVFVYVVVGVTAVVAVCLFAHGQTRTPLRDAAFQVVSIMTATGYVNTDYDAWPYLPQYILLLLMFTGACAGSTSGGLKLMRMIIVGKTTLRTIAHAVFPNEVAIIKYDYRPLPNRLVAAVVSFFAAYALVWFLAALVLIALEGCDITTGLSAVIALLSNVGPGLAKVGAVQNYGWISNPGKWLLTFIMLAGRLELYAMMVLFLPSTWKK